MVRFTCKVEVRRPREEVVEIFSNPDHFPHFQEGFIKIDRVSGQEGQEGSVSHLYYKMRGTDVMLEETILENRLPDLLCGPLPSQPYGQYLGEPLQQGR